MDQVTITLPDGSQKQVARGTPVAEFIKTQIGAGLAKAALFAKLDDREVDLTAAIDADAKLKVFTNKSAEGLELIRHDAAHVVASVVQRLFPGTQVTIGPTIEDGFYYDFARDKPFTPEELQQIEDATNAEIKRDLPFVRRELSKDEAVALFAGKGEKFKVELVEDIFAKGAKTLSIYSHGDWVDFCLGPHGPSTGRIGVVKLLSTSGAYWRGDHRNPMLQRIYGTAFFTKAELDAYLTRLEEAKKRDHRRLGRELELFTFHPFAPGAAFFEPKGTVLYNLLGQGMRHLMLTNGYVELKTPLMFNKHLWEKSGHWGKYKENMFLVLDSESGEHDYSLKPMNCPSHHLYYLMKKHSYRELPLRFHSQDPLHRNEASGTLGGLTRVRQFQQDDAHIYVAESQVTDEVKRLVALLDVVYKAFGLTYSAKFSTRPEQRLGSDELWDRAEAALKAALIATGLAYEEKAGEGAFYGPKIDFDVSDSIGRKWQLGTIQLDYLAPERFELGYVGEDNHEHRPVVIHRAIYGSFERFIAILVEHYAGVFPTWLAPVQATLLPVSDKFLAYAQEAAAALALRGLRVEVDVSNEKLGAKIRNAEMAKVPFLVVVGEKEATTKAVAPRRHGGKDLGAMPLEQFADLLATEGKFPY